MNRSKIARIFARLSEQTPNPTTELQFETPFELLVAVILSAQATDISVNKATTKLFPLARSPEEMLKLGESKLRQCISNIGLHNTKARNILATCALLLEQHEGEVPAGRADLERLPGVGRKTANVILNTVFGEPTLAVDTHIFRLANRIPLAPGKTPLEVEKKLLRVVPRKYLQDAHHLLILHGRYVCTARKPQCAECVIQDLCEYRRETES